MSRKYIIDTDFQTVSAAQDLLEVIVPSTEVMLIHSIAVFQSSEVLASDAEHLQLTFKRASGSYTTGSGGGTVTPTKTSNGDSSSGLTIKRNNTSQANAGSGTLTSFCRDVFDVLAGYDLTFIPELRFEFSPSSAFIISISAPSDPLTLCVRLFVEELGG